MEPGQRYSVFGSVGWANVTRIGELDDVTYGCKFELMQVYAWNGRTFCVDISLGLREAMNLADLIANGQQPASLWNTAPENI